MIRNRPTRRRLGDVAFDVTAARILTSYDTGGDPLKNYAGYTTPTPSGPPTSGPVGIGSGGNAGDFTYSSGLSNDPRLANYLQNLTPAQLQSALDNADPNPALIQLLRDEQQGTGAGWIPDGSGTPTNNFWMWAALAAVALLIWSHSR
jgi:hypothetical protein